MLRSRTKLVGFDDLGFCAVFHNLDIIGLADLCKQHGLVVMRRNPEGNSPYVDLKKRRQKSFQMPLVLSLPRKIFGAEIFLKKYLFFGIGFHYNPLCKSTNISQS